ncbi:MAG: chromosome condensation regulator RCC1 [Chloroflexi bacterium]|nr:chromosome condensation regulator RCC1 [Chloroflexota bacterium]
MRNTTAILVSVSMLIGLLLGTSMLAAPSQATAPLPVVPASNTPLTFGKVAVGDDHVCAIVSGGEVYCWGRNHYGQLGDGTTLNRSRPVKVQGLNGLAAMDITAGKDHTCVRIFTGGMRCWGYAANGQLGFGIWSSQFYSTPVSVVGLSAGIGAIEAGSSGTCAEVSGAAKCWGDNVSGQMGNGLQPTDSIIPTQVMTLTNGVTSISIGAQSACAVIPDVLADAIRCWGANGMGQLGTGITSSASISVPVAVNGLQPSHIASVGVGYSHACALYDGGAVDCWGGGVYGQMGNGSYTSVSLTPVAASGLPLSSQISSAAYTVCARTNGGAARCWGYGAWGQLGNGTFNNSATPVVVTGLSTGVLQVAVGYFNACAVISGGGLKCWGSNQYGQLGNGTFADSAVPVSVLTVFNYLPIIAR